MCACGWGECNGWVCDACHHHEVETGSWKLAGEPPIPMCSCHNCKRELSKEKKFVFLVKNHYCGGTGEQIRAIVCKVPNRYVGMASWYYLNKIDHTGCLVFEPIPFEKWGGVYEE